MRGSLLVCGSLAAILFGGPMSACQCEVSFSACNELKTSDLVFIGTVNSIEPIFLSRWNADQSPVRSLTEAYLDAEAHPSASTLTQLKNRYVAMFPVMEDREKKLAQAAKTNREVAAIFWSALDHGMRVRLKVRTLFEQEDDEAATNKRNKDERPNDNDAPK